MKFKTGDWVIHNGKFRKVTRAIDGLIDSLDYQVAMVMKDDTLELWQPKEDEWVVTPMPNNCAIIGRYKIDVCMAMDGKNLEPFIGELPTFLVL